MMKKLITDHISELFRENLRRIDLCICDIDNEQLWQKPNKSSNAIGHLILHLNGNITQYILSGLGGIPDTRERDLEFEPIAKPDKEHLWERHKLVIQQAIETIDGLESHQLEQMYHVQGFEMSGVSILIHVGEHYSYHTGQIAFWTKFLENRDLGFYAGQDLNARND